MHSARQWIGAFLLELGGLDALVFTAGIGENRTEMRAAICGGLEGFGLRLDGKKNRDAQACEAFISEADSKVRALVIPTNEELVVAREVRRLLERS